MDHKWRTSLLLLASYIAPNLSAQTVNSQVKPNDVKTESVNFDLKQTLNPLLEKWIEPIPLVSTIFEPEKVVSQFREEPVSTSVPVLPDPEDPNLFKGHLENGTTVVLGGPGFIEKPVPQLPSKKMDIVRSILEAPYTFFIQTHGGGEPGNYELGLDDRLSEYNRYLTKENLYRWIKKENPEIVIIDSCNEEGGLTPETLEHILGPDNRLK